MTDDEKARRFVKNMTVMCNVMDEAESMTNHELAEALCEVEKFGHHRVTDLESAIVGEASHRLQRPFTWRIQRFFERNKRK